MLESFIRSIFKTLLHWFYDQCEIERVCGSGMHDKKMTISFGRSVALSKRLTIYRNLLFQFKVFPIDRAVSAILDIKKVSGKETKLLLKTNMANCLEYHLQINRLVMDIDKMCKSKFSISNKEHVDLLSTLWQSLMPETRLPEIDNHEDWTLLGFQSKTPSSDLRAMGIWGLKQLCMFANRNNDTSRRILREANHERRYFPFAAVGINLSEFILSSLLKKTRLHSMLFGVIDANYINGTTTGNDDNNDGDKDGGEEDNIPLLQQHKQTAMKKDESSASKYIQEVEMALHQLFGDLYAEFCEMWIDDDPQDIMQFPRVFQAFKEKVLMRYAMLKNI